MSRYSRAHTAALLLGIGVAGPLGAAAADPQQCRGVADDAARLGCYDALFAVPPAAVTAAPAAVPAPPPAAPGADFGAETVKRKSTDSPAEQALKARVVGHVEFARKGARYALDNGQVWLNIDDREILLDVDNPAVTIERNFIGSYFMKLDGAGARVRVRRIQ
ncbi:MAG: hypothetical protein JWQ90_4871 [Hydrocarboniphaga sp.]|uniref:hypothetical protein n=1 Tax=Hydrocarboniphaga sp. TaxID=2033016 RepID=UPI00261A0AFF|nr:hypothetical protein [Hydrocarboniphaga sp.]MDB5972421.1 hypothetical protein [Hydrocarboniphaga sp.]